MVDHSLLTEERRMQSLIKAEKEEDQFLKVETLICQLIENEEDEVRIKGRGQS